MHNVTCESIITYSLCPSLSPEDKGCVWEVWGWLGGFAKGKLSLFPAESGRLGWADSVKEQRLTVSVHKGNTQFFSALQETRFALSLRLQLGLSRLVIFASP